MKKNQNRLNYRLKCEGGNVVNLINLCLINGLELNNIYRTNNNYVEFELNDYNLKKFKKLNITSYNISITRIGGKKKILDFILFRFGLIIGLIISIIGMILLNNRLLQIHVYGLTTIDQELIINELKDYGISTFTNMNFDKDKLENFLSQKFNFSLVSIITKGNSLIINVKEELPDIKYSYVPITADYNMVIKSINVYAGTSCVKSGDIVYKGDTLVEPYVKNGNDCVYLKPCADIVANIYFNDSYKFNNLQTEQVKSGNYKLISLSVLLGKFSLINTVNDNDYVDFEIKESISQVSKYFLPITIKKTYSYELVSSQIERDWESEKEIIISKLKENVYKQVPEHISIENEDIVITAVDEGYIINIYLSSTIELKYKYKG